MGQPLHLRAGSALLALALAACAAAPSRSPSPSSSPSTALVPAIPIHDLHGRPHDLRTLAAGRPAILSLWATWCESCAEELAPLGRVHERSRDQGRVLAIAVGERAADVARFASRHHLRYPIYLDPDFQLATALGSQQVPTTLILDREGRIVHRGGLFDAAALAVYRELLEATPPLSVK